MGHFSAEIIHDDLLGCHSTGAPIRRLDGALCHFGDIVLVER